MNKTENPWSARDRRFNGERDGGGTKVEQVTGGAGTRIFLKRSLKRREAGAKPGRSELKAEVSFAASLERSSARMRSSKSVLSITFRRILPTDARPAPMRCLALCRPNFTGSAPSL
jgi:hypothetical protein